MKCAFINTHTERHSEDTFYSLTCKEFRCSECGCTLEYGRISSVYLKNIVISLCEKNSKNKSIKKLDEWWVHPKTRHFVR